jgi:hypothetical protein
MAQTMFSLHNGSSVIHCLCVVCERNTIFSGVIDFTHESWPVENALVFIIV